MAYNKDTAKDNRRKPSSRVAELKRAVRDAERENNTRNREIQDSFKLNSPLAGFDCAEKMTAPKELDSILLQDYSRAETLLTMDQWQEQKSRERIARREAAEQRTENATWARTIGAACDRLTVSVMETLSTLSPAERGVYYANINAKLTTNLIRANTETAAENFHRSRQLLGLEYDPETRHAIECRARDRN
jgi:hypothetical protein